MTDVNFAGDGANSGWTSGTPIYSPGIGLPTGPAMANGSTAVLIVALYGFISGHGASRTVNMALGSAGTGNFGVGSASSAGATGWIGTSAWLVNGGTATFEYNTTGACYFGRTSTSGSINTYDGGAGFTGTLAGYYRYFYATSAPTSFTATPSSSTSGQVDFTWGAPSDNGGATVTSYDLYSSGTLMTSGITGTSYSKTGLTPGTSYSFTLRAHNQVTDAAGTTSVDSNTATATPIGPPSAPQTLTAVASTTVENRVDLSWSAPATVGVGGITNYTVYANSTAIGNPTGTTFAATGLSPNTSYSFYVTAHNAFTGSGSESAASNTATATSPGPPGAPTSLTATPDPSNPGRIVLAWTAPTVTGTGGLTGYTAYTSDGTSRGTTGSGTTTLNVNGLTPGNTYTFYVEARNAIADASGVYSAPSNNATATATGAPLAVTGVTVTPSTTIAGRLIVSWSAATGATAYNVYNVVSGVASLIGATTGLSYTIDGLVAGTTYTYSIAARNAYTDSTVPPSTGAMSSTASGTPGATTSQPVTNTVTDLTNAALSGTFTILSATATTISYADTTANLASATVPTGVVTVTDNTNATLSLGTPTIASIPSSTTLTIATSTTPNVASTAVPSGSLVDTTNQVFNGTFTVANINTPDNHSFQYAKTNANIASVAASGTASDLSNTILNGPQVVTATPTTKTFSYAVSGANLASTQASGTAVDETNSQVFNGQYTVASTPTYNTLTYARIVSAAISNKALTSNVATLTTSTAHGFFTGETVLISGVTGFNGTYTITSTPSTTTFTFALTSANVSSTVVSPTGLAEIVVAPAAIPQDAATATVTPAVSKASLEVQYRSGWAG